MYKKLITIFLMSCSYSLVGMDKKSPTQPIAIQAIKNSPNNSGSYYDRIMASINNTWNSSLDATLYSSSLGDRTDLTDTEINRSGSLIFETNPTPLSSPRKNVQEQEELIHELPTKKSCFFSLLCCCCAFNKNMQSEDYQEIS